MIDKAVTRLQDGLLAGGTCFIASSAAAQQAMVQAAQDVSQAPVQTNPLVTQVLIPIISAIVVPFLKELVIELREKRKARRSRKKGLNQAIEQ